MPMTLSHFINQLLTMVSILGKVTKILNICVEKNKHEQSCISCEILHITSIFVVVVIVFIVVIVECLHSARLAFKVLSSGLAFNVLLLLLHFTSTESAHLFLLLHVYIVQD